MRSSGIGQIVVLVALWVLLWGELTVANVASGVRRGHRGHVRLPDRRRGIGARSCDPLPTMRLGAVVARELVVSNAALTRDVLRRRPQLGAGLVDCPLSCTSPWVGALVANLLALSPGTMPVDVDVDEHVLRLHVLRLNDPAGDPPAGRRRWRRSSSTRSARPAEVASLPAAVRSMNDVSLVVLAVAAVAVRLPAVRRARRWPTGPTRSSGMLTAGAAAIVVRAVDTGNGAFLPVVVVITLVGFVGTAMVARYIEGREQR